MDWLRIAAFAVLVLYHAAMVFAPWHWVVKAQTIVPALIVPMALTSPWRLPLLFAVSGFASRRLFDKGRDPAGFLKARTVRLLVPVGFALVMLLPPELWVRARLAGYDQGLITFWLRDYWQLQSPWGGFPQWEHLWFVVYLWGYTAVLAGLVRIAGTERIDAFVERWLSPARILWLPIVLLVAAKWAMMFVIPERAGLFSDWTAHAEYLPILIFGFVLAGSDRLWPTVLGCWRPAMAVALAAGAVVLGFEITFQGADHPGHAMMMADRAARLAMAWAMVLLGLNLAERWWNRDHRWRATLAEAVFPLYLIHQGAIVLIAWATLGWALPAAMEFALIVTGTVAVAAIFYLAGRRIGWLRPMIGLSPVVRRETARAAPTSPKGHFG